MIKKIIVFTLFLSCSYVFSQKTITGTVKDNEGLLPNVSVNEKSTKKGVVTDFDGNFSIEVSKNNAILVFRYLGYKTLEVSVENKLKIAVTLEEDAESLDEIVVNALGVQVDKRTLANELKLKLFLKNENSKLQSQKSDNVRCGSDTDKDK